MTVRDLGYRPYKGKRLPASNNNKVLLRHGLKRAWGSWLVKTSAFVGWLPPVAFMAVAGFGYWLSSQNSQVQPMEAAQAAEWVNRLIYVQVWGFVSMVTLGAGASVISEDFTHKAFQFYFAKPITRLQYLVGRMSAVAIWCFGLTFIPAALFVLLLMGVVEETQRLETVGLLLPAFLHCSVIATVCATASVGISSLSRSRALTMSAWLLMFIVPHIIAVIVQSIGEWPWLRLLSLPALIEVAGDALFKVAREDELEWFHVLPILAALSAGGIGLASHRLRSAEVIS